MRQSLYVILLAFAFSCKPPKVNNRGDEQAETAAEGVSLAGSSNDMELVVKNASSNATLMAVSKKKMRFYVHLGDVLVNGTVRDLGWLDPVSDQLFSCNFMEGGDPESLDDIQCQGNGDLKRIKSSQAGQGGNQLQPLYYNDRRVLRDSKGAMHYRNGALIRSSDGSVRWATGAVAFDKGQTLGKMRDARGSLLSVLDKNRKAQQDGLNLTTAKAKRVKDATPPAPANISGRQINDSSVTFSWDSGGGSTAKYAVSLYTDTVSKKKPVACLKNQPPQLVYASKYEAQNLVPGVAYTLAICALNGSANPAKPQAKNMSAPVLFTFVHQKAFVSVSTVGTTTMDLRFNYTTNYTGFSLKVEEGDVDSGTIKLPVTVSFNAPATVPFTKQLADLKPNTVYSVSVYPNGGSNRIMMKVLATTEMLPPPTPYPTSTPTATFTRTPTPTPTYTSTTMKYWLGKERPRM